MLYYPLNFPKFEVVKWRLGFGGTGSTGYEDRMGKVRVYNPSILQANPMKYAKEMLCYPLNFSMFRVVGGEDDEDEGDGGSKGNSDGGIMVTTMMTMTTTMTMMTTMKTTRR